MAKAAKEISTSDMPINQPKPVDLAKVTADREPEIIKAEHTMDREYMEEIAFNEEPVTILISPSNEKNAPPSYPAWNNGKGAEVMMSGKWVEFTYLPVNTVLIVKRKYVGILLSSKVERVETIIPQAGSPDIDKYPGGQLQRFITGACTFTIIEDKNPRGAEWAQKLRLQQF